MTTTHVKWMLGITAGLNVLVAGWNAYDGFTHHDVLGMVLAVIGVFVAYRLVVSYQRVVDLEWLLDEMKREEEEL